MKFIRLYKSSNMSIKFLLVSHILQKIPPLNTQQTSPFATQPYLTWNLPLQSLRGFEHPGRFSVCVSLWCVSHVQHVLYHSIFKGMTVDWSISPINKQTNKQTSSLPTYMHVQSITGITPIIRSNIKYQYQFTSIKSMSLTAESFKFIHSNPNCNPNLEQSLMSIEYQYQKREISNLNNAMLHQNDCNNTFFLSFLNRSYSRMFSVEQ